MHELFPSPEGTNLVQQITNSSLGKRGLFDYEFINWMADEHLRGSRDWSANLWCLLNLSVWYDRWIG